MKYAQIKNNVVKNTIELADDSILNLFSEGYDVVVRIDELQTQPGIGWTYNGSAFAAPTTTAPSVPIQDQIAKVILNAQDFGKGLMIQFATENVLMGLSQSQMDTLLENLSEVMSALLSGSLKIAILRLNRIDPNSNTTLDATRIQKYRNLIEDYLGVPRT